MKKLLPKILFGLGWMGISVFSNAQSATFSVDMSLPLTNLMHSNTHMLPDGKVITTTFNQTTASSYITLLESNGTQLWTKEYSNTRIDDIHVLDNGKIAFAGYFASYYSIWGVLDANGNQLWSKKLYSYDFNYDLATADVLANGKLLFGFSKFTRNVTVRCDENGNTEDCDEGEDTLGNGKSPRFDNGPCNDSGYVGSCKSDDRIMIIRHNVNGDVMWAKNYMKINTDYFHMKKIQQLSDGNFISIGLVSETYSGQNNFGFILKIDGDGNLIWAKKYFLPGNYGYFTSTFRSIEITSTEMYIGGYYTQDYVNMNNFLMKLDLDGNVIWSKQILPTNSESLGAPIPTSGSVSFEQEIKNGYFIYNNYFNDGNGYHVEINKVNVNGVLGCYVTDMPTTAIPYTGITTTIPAQYGQVSILENNPELITDQILTVSTTSLQMTASCASVAGVEDELTSILSVYPNPAAEVLSLNNLNAEETYLLQLIDVNGRVVQNLRGITGVSTYNFQVSGLSSGNYVLAVTGLNSNTTEHMKWIKQ